MKIWRKMIVLFTIFMFTYPLVFAQTVIRGIVSDEDGIPLSGVNVIIEGTKMGTITDENGKFSISAEVSQKLMISFIGMKSQLVEIKDPSSLIEVTLQEDVALLEEVVVVGYGTQKKESLVGSIATAKGDDLKQGNISTMYDALTGVIPGVSVLSVSGVPGGNLETRGPFTPPDILIRGQTTWNNANPLILVDGVERQMNDLDISEIESVSVLKDASATAVFGVKGGNGVILITTKRGREGKARFNVEYELSYESPSKIIETGDVAEGAIARNIALERSRRFNPGLWNLYYADEEVNYFRTGEYPYAYQNLKWTDVLLKDFTPSSRVNVTVRGGTRQVKYFASAAYNHVGDILRSEDLGQGYLPSYSYDRLNIRSNFDFEISKTTKISANFAGIYGLQTTPPLTSSNYALFAPLSRQSGDVPILQYEDGMYGAEDTQFMATNAYYNLNYDGVSTYPLSTINMDYALSQDLDFITKGLKFSGKLAYDNTFRNTGRSVNDTGYTRKSIDKEFYLNGGYYDYETGMYMLNGEPADMDEWTFYDEPIAGREGFGWVKTPHTYTTEQVSLSNAERTLYYELKLDYARTFNLHSMTAMAIFSRQEVERGSNWPRKREDWVGRITYDYDQRYFLEINGAYNGSEKFGPKYRFDFFPSVAGGWMISNESFIKNNVKWLDELKLRYSYGLVGNDNVSTGSQWPYLTIWNTYGFNQEEPTGFGWPSPYMGYPRYNEGNPGNPDLRWEKATKQNFGLELGILNQKVNLTADFFSEHRTDMLLPSGQRNVPPLFGKDPPPANVGEAKSQGAEIEIMYRNSVNKFNYWVSANWTVARSEIIHKESPALLPEHLRPEGKPVGQTFSGISSGFIESWDDVYAATGGADDTKNIYLMPGDLMMIDFNSDGLYNSNDDNVPYGYPTYPQNNYGINLGGDYKGIDFSVRFTGGYNATRNIEAQLFYNNNMYAPTFLLNETWSPEYNNENLSYPALALNSAKQYNPLGEFREYDGSFFRLQSAQIGYSLPKRWIEPLRMNNLKLYVNGRNLFLWTRMPNDGVGIDDPGFNYPTKKQINFGLNIQF